MKLTKDAIKQFIREELMAEDADPQDSKEACDKAGGVWTEGADHPCDLTGMPQRPTVTESKKITKKALKQLVKEELEALLHEDRGWKFKFVDLDKRTQRMAKRLGMTGDEQVFVVDSAPTRTDALKMVYSQLLAKLARQRSKR